MPTYRFQCRSCGLNFKKRTTPSGKATCKCGSLQTVRMVPESVRVAFGSNSESPLPQNTGISAVDYSADRTIGESAAKIWGDVSDRNRRKREVLAENPGVSGDRLSRFSIDTREGVEFGADYLVMAPEEDNARKLACSIHQKALEAGVVPEADIGVPPKKP